MSVKTLAQFKKLAVLSEYSRLDPDIFLKIDSCIRANEPFGLECPDSIVAIVPQEFVAVWYSLPDYNKAAQVYVDLENLLIFISSLLFTHDSFMGPLTLGKFLNAVKIIEQDAADRKPRIELLP